ncbi:allophanate hydrolase [Actinocorallia sp. API 0066]|uniref:allophanate hydrolase n=1 Tax=Actinocorallia sp. API 0066 TaxID=2896846 RepID=UPI001E5B050F|nr:allophanate hydrolase [Actinocorallia sp. API 0066]MCD0453030.1 allophanate hydrolase [Actinocorallia sp. API 0066]
MPTSTVARVRQAYARIAETDRPEVWITLRPEADVHAEAVRIDARTADGADLPLAGTLLAVKDNIDVAGLPTTAACPAYAYTPDVSAPAVARLQAAGAVVLGKTNMDQFATGLVGTRSPYGAVRCAHDPALVSGGSSSGSAVAVALGIVDLALGTDTAGSGRVPAAFQGIVGIKPTIGLIPNVGVVPAVRSLDCVTVFARTVAEAQEAVHLMVGPGCPRSRGWPADAPLAAPPVPRVAVPDAPLPGLTPAWADAFARTLDRLSDAGAVLVPVDVSPFLEAAELLYGGAFTAERYAAVGAFIDAHPLDTDPSVRAIISPASGLRAHALARDVERLDHLRARALAALTGLDALLLPTAPEHPTIAEVAADPLAVNTRLGRYTNFVNLLDLCALAVPSGEGAFGVTVIARAFADHVAADIARLLAPSPQIPPAAPALPLVVVGAHLSGGPLNHQLTEHGARLVGPVHTAPHYRMYALPTDPPKPGLVRVEAGGHSIEGELWLLPPAALGHFLAALPSPMTLGRLLLTDGTTPTGFLCEPHATTTAPDISPTGSWRTHLTTTTP